MAGNETLSQRPRPSGQFLPRDDEFAGYPTTFIDFSNTLAEALPDDKQEKLWQPEGDPVDFGEDFEEALGYATLDWYLRVWMPTWLGRLSTDMAAMVSGGQSVTSPAAAAQFSAPIATLCDLVGDPEADQIAKGDEGILGEAVLLAAQTATPEAIRASAGDIALTAALSAVPEACELADTDRALRLTRNVIFACAFDAALEGSESIIPTTNSNTIRIVLKNMLPAACRVSLKSTITTLQNSAIELHNSLLTSLT